MYALIDLATDRVLQAVSTTQQSESLTVNGKYIISIPEGCDVELTSSSFVFPQNASSISGLSSTSFLTRYPMFDYVSSNYLLEDTDMQELDTSPAAPAPAARVGYGTIFPRCKIGRGTGPSPVGTCPNSSVMLPVAENRASPVPGAIITDTIDISGSLPAGTENIMLWWDIGFMTTSEDVSHGYANTAGENSPVVKTFDRLDPEFSSVEVWASNDDGVTWVQASYLTPIAFAALGTLMRLAFVNYSSSDIHLLAYSFLFV